MSKIPITLEVNGVPYELLADPGRSLADALRDDLGLTGTKRACNEGECASCAVHLDGEVVNSCLVLAVQAQGQKITTIEGLAHNGTLDPVQEAFATHFASQCGYCTPGMIMTAKAFLATNPTPTEDEVRQAIRGNLCRCTGYSRIVDAIMAASGQTVQVREYRPSEHRVVGQSLPRADSLEKVTGKAPYAYDMRLPGMLHGEILRSPHPSARIVSIDTVGRRRDAGRARRLHAGRHAAEQVRRVRAGRDRARRRRRALPGRGRRGRDRDRRADRAARDGADRRRLRADPGRVRSRGGDGGGRAGRARRRRAQRRRPQPRRTRATSTPASRRPTTSSRTGSSRAASATRAWSRTRWSPTTTRRGA